VPTLLVVDGFRFWFYSNERDEPAHVHASKGSGIAKVWSRPLSIAYSHGLTPGELRRVRELSFENQASFVERWNEYFDR
jgi:hypothetical protein